MDFIEAKSQCKNSTGKKQRKKHPVKSVYSEIKQNTNLYITIPPIMLECDLQRKGYFVKKLAWALLKILYNV